MPFLDSCTAFRAQELICLARKQRNQRFYHPISPLTTLFHSFWPAPKIPWSFFDCLFFSPLRFPCSLPFTVCTTTLQLVTLKSKSENVAACGTNNWIFFFIGKGKGMKQLLFSRTVDCLGTAFKCFDVKSKDSKALICTWPVSYCIAVAEVKSKDLKHLGLFKFQREICGPYWSIVTKFWPWKSQYDLSTVWLNCPFLMAEFPLCFLLLCLVKKNCALADILLLDSSRAARLLQECKMWRSLFSAAWPCKCRL